MRKQLKWISAIAIPIVLYPSVSMRAEPGDVSSVRGIVKAQHTSKLSSALVARVTALPFKVGQFFSRSDTLVLFDCRSYQADLRALEAEVEVNKVTAEQNRQLVQYRAGGSNDLAISEANLAGARAKLDSMRLRLSQCAIKAPFDGRIAEELVQLHETPQANAPLLKIVSEGKLNLQLIVPSNWIVWLRPGQKFSFEVDETHSVHEAEVLHLGAVVDPISRTLKVTAIFKEKSQVVRPGMSGTAKFLLPNG